MIKICLVVPKFLPVPAIKGGAIETLVTNIIDVNEIEHRVDFTVVCPYDKEALSLQGNYKYTKFINVKKSRFDNFIFVFFRICRKYLKKYILFLDRYEYKAFAELKKENFDLIINESSEFNVFVYLSKHYGREKISAHLHCEIYNKPHFSRTYGSIITVSDYIKRKYLSSGGFNQEDVYTLHNGIVQKNFSKELSVQEKLLLRNELGIAEQDFVIIYSGRVVEVKGIEQLINAVVRIKSIPVKLLIIGSPNFGVKKRSPFLSRIESLVSMHGEKIKFTGFVHNTELYRYYNISNVAVIPSVYEDPAPLVPIEAMAAGMPIIATNSGGIWEFLDDKCAIKVTKEADLERQLVDSIELLYNNDDLRFKMAQNSKVRAAMYDNSVFYDNFCQTAIRIISNNNE